MFELLVPIAIILIVFEFFGGLFQPEGLEHDEIFVYFLPEDAIDGWLVVI